MDYSSIVSKVKDSVALVLRVNATGITGKGSGFVYGKKGLLVTCNHVVSGDDAIKIKLVDDSKEFIDAKVVIRDEEHDLALLKYDDSKVSGSEPLIPIELEKICEGMAVFFAGYPLSLSSLTTHQGILSAIIKDETGITTFLIDGTVNAGNSGCPLMDISGNVIGVVNAKRRERTELLQRVENLETGALSMHGIDLIELYQALISNVQLGMGYAVPCSYIPDHKTNMELVDLITQNTKPETDKNRKDKEKQ